MPFEWVWGFKIGDGLAGAEKREERREKREEKEKRRDATLTSSWFLYI